MSTNPLLSKVIVNPIIRRLPSGGYLYTDGELADSVMDGEIKIFPMNSLDEIEIKSPDLLLTGEGVINVIRRRCPEVLKPERLLTHDIDYILYMMRISSYGSEMEITYTHNCNEEIEKLENELREAGTYEQNKSKIPEKYEVVEHNYVINLEMQLARSSHITSSDIDKRFNFKISTGQIITITPSRFNQFIEYMSDLTTEYSMDELKTISKVLENRLAMEDVEHKRGLVEMIRNISPNTSTTKKAIEIINGVEAADIVTVIKKSIKLIEREIEKKNKTETERAAANLDKFYSEMISSVDGVTNKEHIVEWLGELGIKDKEKIGDRIAKTSEGWGIPRDTTITCQTCEKEITRDLDLNPLSFFS